MDLMNPPLLLVDTTGIATEDSGAITGNLNHTDNDNTDDVWTV